MSFPTVQGQAPEGSPMREAQSCLGPAFANSTYQFFLTGTSTPANVYQDGALTNPFPITGFVTADNFGRFPPIYLDTSVVYKVQFYDSTNTLRWTVDPYTPLLATVGTSSLSAFGPKIAATGEITIPAPNTGGSGLSLTLTAPRGGGAALRVSALQPGNSAIIVNSSATTGAQTATFNANNRPGSPPTSVFNVALTVAPSGATYTGGTLTANFTGPTANTYTVQLSTGQDIFNATLTNGSTTFTTPSTNISGTPTVNLIATSPVTPTGWLPITCDGVQYYTPIWRGSSFGSALVFNPSANGEAINAQSVTFGGNGLTTATGGTAMPGNWYSPTTANIGGGYYINITKTGGLSGLAFSAAQGAWTNITNSGITISSNAQAAIGGTYQLSSSVTGTPVVASGTITLSGNNGVQQPTYNGAANLVLAGNGTATLNGVGASNWYAPTTANVGSGYYIKINQTGGSSGTTFSAASGVYANITNGGLTIGLTGGTGTTNATGNYIIASDSGGVNQLGTGTITLTGGSNVQSPNWSGTTPLKLNGDGSATLNGVSTSSWYLPNTANVGSGYWIDITRTGGTSGVNFSAAQGSWTNITNSGLSIDMTGYTGDVGTVTVNGNWQISNSSSGTPVLGSGTISLSVNAGTIVHVYTSGTSATETAPTGTSNVVIEVFGSGGGGGGGKAGCSGNGGGGGGSGGYARSSYACTGGKTIIYTVPSTGGSGGGVGGGGTNGSSSTVSSGTLAITAMTAPGGGGGSAGSSGGGGGAAGATGTGGNVANTTGNAGANHSGCAGGAGGAGVTGVNGNGLAGGRGGAQGSIGSAGNGGKVIFFYS